MDQITWILAFIPGWFWTLVLILGIVCLLVAWVLKKVPMVATNRLLIQVVGYIAILIGSFAQGVAYNEEKWQAEIKRLEEKVKEAEGKARVTNVEIQKEIVFKDKIIKEKGETVIKYVEKIVKGDVQEIVKDMSQAERDAFTAKQKELEQAIANCPVPSLIVEQHNKAAKPPLKDPAK